MVKDRIDKNDILLCVCMNGMRDNLGHFFKKNVLVNFIFYYFYFLEYSSL